MLLAPGLASGEQVSLWRGHLNMWGGGRHVLVIAGIHRLLVML